MISAASGNNPVPQQRAEIYWLPYGEPGRNALAKQLPQNMKVEYEDAAVSITTAQRSGQRHLSCQPRLAPALA